MIQCVTEGEIFSRATKNAKDLSIAYNLLVSNLNSNLSSINNAKADLSAHSRFSNGAPSPKEGCSMRGLGQTTIGLIMNKLDAYSLQFNNIPTSPETNGDRKYKLEGWSKDICGIVDNFVVREVFDGWY